MRDFDADVRLGEEVGPNRFIWREYSVIEDGKRISVTYYDKDREIPEGAVFIGIHEHHKSTHNPELWCGGYLRFQNVPEAVEAGHALHDLVSEKPLTIAPSLGCRGCKSHGYIRDGKWVDA